jgi:glutamate-1-semialdehyde 2,1-aminomutase
MNNQKSVELFRQARERIPGGVNSPARAFRAVGGTPVYIASASGAGFTDADGNRYVDFCQSWGPLILGHARPEVVEAVRDAAGRGLSYGAVHEGEIRMASLVLEAFPEYQRVRAVSSGTEAVMTALRIARGKTGRERIVKFDGGYHGHFDGLLVKAGSGLATLAIADSGGVPAGIAETTLVAPLDDREAVTGLFDRHGRDIAAVIIEPMPANNGLLLQRPEFLKFLREICTQHGALLIFDEVISGFRLQFGGYGQMMGVTADLVTLGKIIGGGMPVGAVVGPADVMDVLSPVGSVYQAGTLSGNPVSLAAGATTLRLLRDESPYARLAELGRAFAGELSRGAPGHVRALVVGSVLWPYFASGDFPRCTATIDKAHVKRFNAIYWKMLERGFYLPPSGLEVGFISTAHTLEQVTGLAAALREELAAIA